MPVYKHNLNFNTAISSIKPDLRKKTAFYKAMKIFGVLISALGFICFGLTGFFVASSGGELSFAYIFIPFFAFPSGAIITSLMSGRAAAVNKLLGIVDAVNDTDAEVIDKLGVSCGYNAVQSHMVIEKLIETGNLVGYELVAERVVAKTGSITESEAVRMIREHDEAFGSRHAAAPAAAVGAAGAAVPDAPAKCPDCGAPTDSASLRFCEYCGRRLH